MKALPRTIVTALMIGIATLVWGTIVIVAAAFGVKHEDESILDRSPRIWARWILWAAGVTVRVHGLEKLRDADGVIRGPFIFASNHISYFDIPALERALPRHHFVAKKELFSIPVFGPGIRAVGTVPIERNNQKSAFGSYNIAADLIRNGSSVVVFPEGTRGVTYPIREFKKGPFVLAIQAGVPIIPCLIHGTIEVLPRNALRIQPGFVDVHLLDPVPTSGLTYEDRDELARVVHDRMASLMATTYPNSVNTNV